MSDSFETPMTVAHKAPLSMRFPRQEYWSGDFPGGPVVKILPVNARDMDAIPGLGRSHMPQSNQACAPQLLRLCAITRGTTATRSPHAATESRPGSGATTRESPRAAVKTHHSPCPPNNSHNKIGGNPSILPGPRAFEIAVNVL